MRAVSPKAGQHAGPGRSGSTRGCGFPTYAMSSPSTRTHRPGSQVSAVVSRCHLSATLATRRHRVHVHAVTAADVHGDHWQIHSDADEFVAVLSGRMRMYLRVETAGSQEDSVTVPAGGAFAARGHQPSLTNASFRSTGPHMP